MWDYLQQYVYIISPAANQLFLQLRKICEASHLKGRCRSGRHGHVRCVLFLVFVVSGYAWPTHSGHCGHQKLKDKIGRRRRKRRSGKRRKSVDLAVSEKQKRRRWRGQWQNIKLIHISNKDFSSSFSPAETTPGRARLLLLLFQRWLKWHLSGGALWEREHGRLS